MESESADKRKAQTGLAQSIPAPSSAREAFTLYLRLGLNPLPAHPRSKAIALEGTDAYSRKAKVEDLDAFFPDGQERNICVVNGDLSDREADVDLDCREAVLLAPRFLKQ